MHDPTSQLILFALLLPGVLEQEAKDAPAVTWHGEVAPLIEKNCSSCHQPGQVGPFTLQTYEDVARRGQFIAHVINEGLMPPWLPTDGLPVRGDRSMSEADRTLIHKWIEAGMPRGTPTKQDEGTEAASQELVEAPILMRASMREPWSVPAEGGVRWFKAERDKRTFVLPLENTKPLRIGAIEYRTKAPLAVAATALSADTTGNARRLVDWNKEPGTYMMGDIGYVAAGSLGVVGPGGGRLEFPTGFHLVVPSGADIVSEVHFRPQGRAWELDDFVLLEQVDATASSRALIPVNLLVRRIELDPGEVNDFSSELTLPLPVDLVAITPRASRRCTKLRVEAFLPSEPDGADEPEGTLILEVDDWNPHYRSTLVFEEPARLPAGTRIKATWHYDNREANPRNPVVPPEEVYLGARVGLAHVLLMCAAVDQEQTEALRKFAEAEVRNRQR